MAEWLKKAVDEVDKQFEQLPDWKKIASQQEQKSCSSQEQRSSTIREPRQRQD